MAIEKTFGIIKPNAVEAGNIGNILAIYEKNGFSVDQMRLTTLTREKAEGFYAEHKERPFFGSLVDFMTSGPVVLYVLTGENAVVRNREIMGATNPEEAAEGTIRKLYANSIEANAVHGSDSPTSAAREIGYFFS